MTLLEVCHVIYSASQKSLNGTHTSSSHFCGITSEPSLDLYARYSQTTRLYSPITRWGHASWYFAPVCTHSLGLCSRSLLVLSHSLALRIICVHACTHLLAFRTHSLRACTHSLCAHTRFLYARALVQATLDNSRNVLTRTRKLMSECN